MCSHCPERAPVRVTLGAAVLLALAMISLTGCDREARRFRVPATVASTPSESGAAEVQKTAKASARDRSGPYDGNAYSVAQGKRLYVWFNCVGCHGMGGGGMGPALMDDKWLYGHEPRNIFTSIAEGRPNGMPAFGERISEQQVWQLVAYVRSMSGLIRDDALPGRSDTLKAVEPELRRDELEPRPSPKSPPPK